MINIKVETRDSQAEVFENAHASEAMGITVVTVATKPGMMALAKDVCMECRIGWTVCEGFVSETDVGVGKTKAVVQNSLGEQTVKKILDTSACFEVVK